MPNKPVPTSLKILRGNPGKRKLNKREPKPLAGTPEFPEWLADLGDPALRGIWDGLTDRLNRAKVLTECDQEALGQLVHKILLYRKAAQILKDGCSYECETESGATMHRQKPEYAIVSDLGKQIRGLLTDFGLTPSSRSKVQTVGGESDDPFAEFFGIP
jgi:P27 family predicted phage terminase small subunit